MKINSITLSDLRRMNGKEGLILQGCGGEIKEWMDGINKMLTDKGILLDDTKFENVSVFMSDGVTCILYPFEDVHLDIGKLAMWRLQSYTAFVGTWLSDYVDNKLGGFIIDEQSKAGQTRLCIDRSGWQYIQSVRNCKPYIKAKQYGLRSKRNVQSCYEFWQLLRSAEHYRRICKYNGRQ